MRQAVWAVGMWTALSAAAQEPPAIPLRQATYFFDARRDGPTRVIVVGEMKIDGLSFAETNGRRAADVAIAVSAVQGGRTFGGAAEPVSIRVSDAQARGVWYRFTRELRIPHGAAELRLSVADRRGGAAGALVAPITVPGEEGLRVSTPILSDTAKPDPVEKSRKHATLGASRTFAASGVLYCELEVYGAVADRGRKPPRASVGFSLLRRGRVEREQAPAAVPPADGRRIAFLELPLAGLKPDDYELVLNVKDEVSGRTLTRREAFTVARPAAPTAILYEDALHDYADGRSDEALHAIVGWPVVKLAERARALPPSLARAAILLHTELGLALLSSGQIGDGRGHLEIARETAARAEAATAFRRDWLIATGAELQARFEAELALPFFLECEQAFPQSAEAWLGAGTVYELSAYPNGLASSRLRGAADVLAKDAERSYRQALTVDPSLAEARLRLGRVLERLGRRGEARLELARAAEDARGGTAALAHLFLGEARTADGALADAEREYRAALAADGSLQPAAVALSALLASQGDREEAVQALRRPLRACPAGVPLWLAYHLGLATRAEEAMARLRQGVQS